jgi:hypothetical protein
MTRILFLTADILLFCKFYLRAKMQRIACMNIKSVKIRLIRVIRVPSLYDNQIKTNLSKVTRYEPANYPAGTWHLLV